MTTFTFDLTGRTALVTGAGQGVGREIAHTLADHGAKVAVNDFVIDRALAVTHEIHSAGGRAAAFQCDVGEFQEVQAMVTRVGDELGPIDILVNNAGNAGPNVGMPRLDFWSSDPETWDVYLRVNLTGVMFCARACSPGMVARQQGRIITIVSDAGRTGEQGHEAYSAAKAGAAGFSRALARALGRHSITVNTISLSNIARGDSDLDPQNQARIKEMLKRYIVRRQGLPTDVAAVALLLASDHSSWITGQNYPVNGGFALAL
jgi:2-hydroxycyclohexanecarboxyl-CoA dehydrogenase